jgi:hypothetical protein
MLGKQRYRVEYVNDRLSKHENSEWLSCPMIAKVSV